MKRFFKRAFALITIILFSTTQLSPVYGFDLTVAASPEVRPSHAFSVNLPSELGTLETVHSGAGPVIIHLQDAHGLYENEKKIQAMLHYFKDTYGIKLVLVEGTPFKFHPELTRFDPDNMAFNMQVMELLAEEGVASGPELFLTKETDAEAYGIENLEAYVENMAAFHAVLSQKEKTKDFLESIDLQIKRLTSPYLNPSLKNFLKRLEDFDQKVISFQNWLFYLKKQSAKHLELNLSHAGHQIKWPMLVRLFKIHEFEEKIDWQAFEKEKEAFLKGVLHFARNDDLEQIRGLLSTRLGKHTLPDPETSQLFEGLVSKLPHNFDYSRYPNVNLFIGHLILQSEIKTNRLFEEIQQLERMNLEALAQTEEEKKVIELLEGYRLLQKLFALQLTPGEYEDSRLRGNDTEVRGDDTLPSRLIRRFEAVNEDNLVRNLEINGLEEIDALYEKALDFYRGAQARDPIMLKNVERVLKQTGEQKAVLITGGFHAQPFEDFFKSKHYRYARITPKLTKVHKSKNYVNAILENFEVKNKTLKLLPRTHTTLQEKKRLKWKASSYNQSVVRALLRAHRTFRSEGRSPATVLESSGVDVYQVLATDERGHPTLKEQRRLIRLFQSVEGGDARAMRVLIRAYQGLIINRMRNWLYAIETLDLSVPRKKVRKAVEDAFIRALHTYKLKYRSEKGQPIRLTTHFMNQVLKDRREFIQGLTPVKLPSNIIASPWLYPVYERALSQLKSENQDADVLLGRAKKKRLKEMMKAFVREFTPEEGLERRFNVIDDVSLESLEALSILLSRRRLGEGIVAFSSFSGKEANPFDEPNPRLSLDPVEEHARQVEFMEQTLLPELKAHEQALFKAVYFYSGEKKGAFWKAIQLELGTKRTPGQLEKAYFRIRDRLARSVGTAIREGRLTNDLVSNPEMLAFFGDAAMTEIERLQKYFPFSIYLLDQRLPQPGYAEPPFIRAGMEPRRIVMEYLRFLRRRHRKVFKEFKDFLSETNQTTLKYLLDHPQKDTLSLKDIAPQLAKATKKNMSRPLLEQHLFRIMSLAIFFAYAQHANPHQKLAKTVWRMMNTIPLKGKLKIPRRIFVFLEDNGIMSHKELLRLSKKTITQGFGKTLTPWVVRFLENAAHSESRLQVQVPLDKKATEIFSGRDALAFPPKRPKVKTMRMGEVIMDIDEKPDPLFRSDYRKVRPSELISSLGVGKTGFMDGSDEHPFKRLTSNCGACSLMIIYDAETKETFYSESEGRLGSNHRATLERALKRFRGRDNVYFYVSRFGLPQSVSTSSSGTHQELLRQTVSEQQRLIDTAFDAGFKTYTATPAYTNHVLNHYFDPTESKLLVEQRKEHEYAEGQPLAKVYRDYGVSVYPQASDQSAYKIRKRNAKGSPSLHEQYRLITLFKSTEGGDELAFKALLESYPGLIKKRVRNWKYAIEALGLPYIEFEVTKAIHDSFLRALESYDVHHRTPKGTPTQFSTHFMNQILRDRNEYIWSLAPDISLNLLTSPWIYPAYREARAQQRSEERESGLQLSEAERRQRIKAIMIDDVPRAVPEKDVQGRLNKINGVNFDSLVDANDFLERGVKRFGYVASSSESEKEMDPFDQANPRIGSNPVADQLQEKEFLETVLLPGLTSEEQALFNAVHSNRDEVTDWKAVKRALKSKRSLKKLKQSYQAIKMKIARNLGNRVRQGRLDASLVRNPEMLAFFEDAAVTELERLHSHFPFSIYLLNQKLPLAGHSEPPPIRVTGESRQIAIRYLRFLRASDPEAFKEYQVFLNPQHQGTLKYLLDRPELDELSMQQIADHLSKRKEPIHRVLLEQYLSRIMSMGIFFSYVHHENRHQPFAQTLWRMMKEMPYDNVINSRNKIFPFLEDNAIMDREELLRMKTKKVMAAFAQKRGPWVLEFLKREKSNEQKSEARTAAQEVVQETREYWIRRFKADPEDSQAAQSLLALFEAPIKDRIRDWKETIETLRLPYSEANVERAVRTAFFLSLKKFEPGRKGKKGEPVKFTTHFYNQIKDERNRFIKSLTPINFPKEIIEAPWIFGVYRQARYALHVEERERGGLPANKRKARTQEIMISLATQSVREKDKGARIRLIRKTDPDLLGNLDRMLGEKIYREDYTRPGSSAPESISRFDFAEDRPLLDSVEEASRQREFFEQVLRPMLTPKEAAFFEAVHFGSKAAPTGARYHRIQKKLARGLGERVRQGRLDPSEVGNPEMLAFFEEAAKTREERIQEAFPFSIYLLDQRFPKQGHSEPPAISVDKELRPNVMDYLRGLRKKRPKAFNRYLAFLSEQTQAVLTTLLDSPQTDHMTEDKLLGQMKKKMLRNNLRAHLKRIMSIGIFFFYVQEKSPHQEFAKMIWRMMEELPLRDKVKVPKKIFGLLEENEVMNRPQLLQLNQKQIQKGLNREQAPWALAFLQKERNASSESRIESESILESLQTAKTVQTLLNGLGDFNSELPLEWSSKVNEDGAIAFRLNNHGKEFFRNLLKGLWLGRKIDPQTLADVTGTLEINPDSIDDEISESAFILVRKEESASGKEIILPFGVMVKTEEDAVLLDFTEIAIQGLNLKRTLEEIKADTRASAEQIKREKSSSTQDLVPFTFERMTFDGESWVDHEEASERGLDIQENLSLFFLESERPETMPTALAPNIEQGSGDWQQLLLDIAQLQPERFKKNIGLVGAGIGTDLVLLAKLGARSVHGTDLYYLYVLLSQINMQFAVDTKQVADIPWTVELRDGLPSTEEIEDLYFNTPGIGSEIGEGARTLFRFGQLFDVPYFQQAGMTSHQFVDLFGQIKAFLLKRPDVNIIMRAEIDPKSELNSDFQNRSSFSLSTHRFFESHLDLKVDHLLGADSKYESGYFFEIRAKKESENSYVPGSLQRVLAKEAGQYEFPVLKSTVDRLQAWGVRHFNIEGFLELGNTTFDLDDERSRSALDRVHANAHRSSRLDAPYVRIDLNQSPPTAQVMTGGIHEVADEEKAAHSEARDKSDFETKLWDWVNPENEKGKTFDDWKTFALWFFQHFQEKGMGKLSEQEKNAMFLAEEQMRHFERLARAGIKITQTQSARRVLEDIKKGRIKNEKLKHKVLAYASIAYRIIKAFQAEEALGGLPEKPLEDVSLGDPVETYVSFNSRLFLNVEREATGFDDDAPAFMHYPLMGALGVKPEHVGLAAASVNIKQILTGRYMGLEPRHDRNTLVAKLLSLEKPVKRIAVVSQSESEGVNPPPFLLIEFDLPRKASADERFMRLFLTREPLSEFPESEESLDSEFLENGIQRKAEKMRQYAFAEDVEPKLRRNRIEQIARLVLEGKVLLSDEYTLRRPEGARRYAEALSKGRPSPVNGEAEALYAAYLRKLELWGREMGDFAPRQTTSEELGKEMLRWDLYAYTKGRMNPSLFNKRFEIFWQNQALRQFFQSAPSETQRVTYLLLELLFAPDEKGKGWLIPDAKVKDYLKKLSQLIDFMATSGFDVSFQSVRDQTPEDLIPMLHLETAVMLLFGMKLSYFNRLQPQLRRAIIEVGAEMYGFDLNVSPTALAEAGTLQAQRQQQLARSRASFWEAFEAPQDHRYQEDLHRLAGRAALHLFHLSEAMPSVDPSELPSVALPKNLKNAGTFSWKESLEGVQTLLSEKGIDAVLEARVASFKESSEAHQGLFDIRALYEAGDTQEALDKTREVLKQTQDSLSSQLPPDTRERLSAFETRLSEELGVDSDQKADAEALFDEMPFKERLRSIADSETHQGWGEFEWRDQADWLFSHFSLSESAEDDTGLQRTALKMAEKKLHSYFERYSSQSDFQSGEAMAGRLAAGNVPLEELKEVTLQYAAAAYRILIVLEDEAERGRTPRIQEDWTHAPGASVEEKASMMRREFFDIERGEDGVEGKIPFFVYPKYPHAGVPHGQHTDPEAPFSIRDILLLRQAGLQKRHDNNVLAQRLINNTKLPVKVTSVAPSQEGEAPYLLVEFDGPNPETRYMRVFISKEPISETPQENELAPGYVDSHFVTDLETLAGYETSLEHQSTPVWQHQIAQLYDLALEGRLLVEDEYSVRSEEGVRQFPAFISEEHPKEETEEALRLSLQRDYERRQKYEKDAVGQFSSPWNDVAFEKIRFHHRTKGLLMMPQHAQAVKERFADAWALPPGFRQPNQKPLKNLALEDPEVFEPFKHLVALTTHAESATNQDLSWFITDKDLPVFRDALVSLINFARETGFHDQLVEAKQALPERLHPAFDLELSYALLMGLKLPMFGYRRDSVIRALATLVEADTMEDVVLAPSMLTLAVQNKVNWNRMEQKNANELWQELGKPSDEISSPRVRYHGEAYAQVRFFTQTELPSMQAKDLMPFSFPKNFKGPMVTTPVFATIQRNLLEKGIPEMFDRRDQNAQAAEDFYREFAGIREDYERGNLSGAREKTRQHLAQLRENPNPLLPEDAVEQLEAFEAQLGPVESDPVRDFREALEQHVLETVAVRGETDPQSRMPQEKLLEGVERLRRISQIAREASDDIGGYESAEVLERYTSLSLEEKIYYHLQTAEMFIRFYGILRSGVEYLESVIETESDPEVVQALQEYLSENRSEARANGLPTFAEGAQEVLLQDSDWYDARGLEVGLKRALGSRLGKKSVVRIRSAQENQKQFLRETGFVSDGISEGEEETFIIPFDEDRDRVIEALGISEGGAVLWRENLISEKFPELPQELVIEDSDWAGSEEPEVRFRNVLESRLNQRSVVRFQAKEEAHKTFLASMGLTSGGIEGAERLFGQAVIQRLDVQSIRKIDFTTNTVTVTFNQPFTFEGSPYSSVTFTRMEGVAPLSDRHHSLKFNNLSAYNTFDDRGKEQSLEGLREKIGVAVILTTQPELSETFVLETDEAQVFLSEVLGSSSEEEAHWSQNWVSEESYQRGRIDYETKIKKQERVFLENELIKKVEAAKKTLKEALEAVLGELSDEVKKKKEKQINAIRTSMGQFSLRYVKQLIQTHYTEGGENYKEALEHSEQEMETKQDSIQDAINNLKPKPKKTPSPTRSGTLSGEQVKQVYAWVSVLSRHLSDFQKALDNEDWTNAERIALENPSATIVQNFPVGLLRVEDSSLASLIELIKELRSRVIALYNQEDSPLAQEEGHKRNSFRIWVSNFTALLIEMSQLTEEEVLAFFEWENRDEAVFWVVMAHLRRHSDEDYTAARFFYGMSLTEDPKASVLMNQTFRQYNQGRTSHYTQLSDFEGVVQTWKTEIGQVPAGFKAGAVLGQSRAKVNLKHLISYAFSKSNAGFRSFLAYAVPALLLSKQSVDQTPSHGKALTVERFDKEEALGALFEMMPSEVGHLLWMPLDFWREAQKKDGVHEGYSFTAELLGNVPAADLKRFRDLAEEHAVEALAALENQGAHGFTAAGASREKITYSSEKEPLYQIRWIAVRPDLAQFEISQQDRVWARVTVPIPRGERIPDKTDADLDGWIYFNNEEALISWIQEYSDPKVQEERARRYFLRSGLPSDRLQAVNEVVRPILGEDYGHHFLELRLNEWVQKVQRRRNIPGILTYSDSAQHIDITFPTQGFELGSIPEEQQAFIRFLGFQGATFLYEAYRSEQVQRARSALYQIPDEERTPGDIEGFILNSIIPSVRELNRQAHNRSEARDSLEQKLESSLGYRLGSNLQSRHYSRDSYVFSARNRQGEKVVVKVLRDDRNYFKESPNTWVAQDNRVFVGHDLSFLVGYRTFGRVRAPLRGDSENREYDFPFEELEYLDPEDWVALDDPKAIDIIQKWGYEKAFRRYAELIQNIDSLEKYPHSADPEGRYIYSDLKWENIRIHQKTGEIKLIDLEIERVYERAENHKALRNRSVNAKNLFRFMIANWFPNQDGLGDFSKHYDRADYQMMTMRGNLFKNLVGGKGSDLSRWKEFVSRLASFSEARATQTVVRVYRGGVVSLHVIQKFGEDTYRKWVLDLAGNPNPQKVRGPLSVKPEILDFIASKPQLRRSYLESSQESMGAEIFQQRSYEIPELVSIAPALIYLALHPQAKLTLPIVASASQFKAFVASLEAYTRDQLGFELSKLKNFEVVSAENKRELAAYIGSQLSRDQEPTAVIAADASLVFERLGSMENLARIHTPIREEDAVALQNAIIPRTASHIRPLTEDRFAEHDARHLLASVQGQGLVEEMKLLISFLKSA